MKKISIVAIATIMVVGSLFTSCEAVKNTNQTQRGAAIGAVGGAVLGGILGNNLGKGGKGAIREVIELILREQDKWGNIIRKYNTK